VSPEVVYGRNPVRELLRAGRRGTVGIFALPQVAGEPWLADAGVEERSRAELGRMAGTSDHQGVVALAEPYPYAAAAELLEAPGPLVALDGAQDPRNLGAIARVAEAAGAGGMAIAERGSPGVTAVVCKASAGAVEHLRVARVPSVAAFVHDAAGAGRLAVGADAERGEDYASLDWPDDPLLVMGAEGAGLRPRVRQACGRLVRIPMAGRIGSLNVSVAAGVLLFHMRRGLPER
jgi:23S rRNA (guanosine2251-2'-O)-methyltransferase